MLHNEARKLLIQALEKTHNAKEVAENFSVNRGTVYRLKRQLEETGSVETRTYVIDPAFKGRGFATEAVNAVINELREMGFKKVVAGFFEGNIGSRKGMEKCGMHLNGNSDYEEYRGKKFKCYKCEMKL